MQEFNNLKTAKTTEELQERMQDMERITSLYSRIADAGFDEEQKLAKLKTLIPADVYKFVAIPAREAGTYDALIQLIQAQMLDTLTGMARGEKPPGLS